MSVRRGTGAARHVGAVALGTAILTAGVVLGPALRPGYVLVGDMVFVPRLPFTSALVGLSAQTPRAVPSDAVVALLSSFLPGQVVQKLLLLGILVAAGTGAAIAVRTGALGSAAAAVAAIWNPYVAERLAAGQWAVLVGYAALPWVVRGAWRWAASTRQGGVTRDAGRWSGVAVPVVLGSLGGAPGWLLVAVAAFAGCALATRGRLLAVRPGLVAGLVAVMALPWAVPALTRPGGTVADAAGAVFAPRADTPLGVVGSLLTGGGIWNDAVVPAGRDSWVGATGALLVLLVGVAGLLRPPVGHAASEGAGDDTGDGRGGVAAAALLAGVLGMVIALVTVPSSLAHAVVGVPAGALLRDGARQVGPWVVAVSIGVGLAVDAAARRRGPWRTVGGVGLAAVVALLPVAALPSAAAGLWGRLNAVQYPQGYAELAARMDAQRSLARQTGAPVGATVVLPFEAYRRYPWNRDRPALDPLPRWLPTRVVASSDLVVRRDDGRAVRVRGEDPFAAATRQALMQHDPTTALAALGVRWVVVDQSGAPVPRGLVERWASQSLRLFEVPQVDDAAARDPDRRWRPKATAVLVADALAVLVVVATVVAPIGASGVSARRFCGAARAGRRGLRRAGLMRTRREGPGDTLR
ncbi:hypothetical protein [Pedococcus sp. 5OH_020]|uniref:hypothetical protein n=1 Tax=Pedococcus sp. 5OH_020 TaxID=2989814 RepID=UPI0022E9AA80|nr:hypothetical protein [Pedococcus sp. 5OH_020]